jgi:hypothetical protein
MSTVVRLPTAAPTFIRVRRRGKWWLVDIVTPCDAQRANLDQPWLANQQPRGRN